MSIRGLGAQEEKFGCRMWVLKIQGWILELLRFQLLVRNGILLFLFDFFFFVYTKTVIALSFTSVRPFWKFAGDFVKAANHRKSQMCFFLCKSSSRICTNEYNRSATKWSRRDNQEEAACYETLSFVYFSFAKTNRKKKNCEWKKINSK